MPLWLQGIVEALVIMLSTIVAVVIPVAMTFFSGGLGSIGFAGAARLGGQAWLLAVGVPLRVGVGSGSSSADYQVGTVQFVPLLFWGFALGLAWVAGRRLARASYSDQLWQPLLTAVITVAGTGAVTALFCSSSAVQASALHGAVYAVIPVILGLLIGARIEAGSWSRLIGVNAAAWVARASQSSKWAGSYVWIAVQAALLSVAALYALSSIVLAVNFVAHWADIVSVYQGLKPGPWGGAGLTLAQLSYVPNFATWTLAYISGAGFELGTNSSISPLGTVVPPIPAIPVLAALPTGTQSWTVLLMVLPVVAGVVAGLYFYRGGENHFDDWLSLKTKQRWLSATGSAVLLGLVLGAIAAVIVGVLAWFSGGSLGFGRLTSVGPVPMTTALYVGVEVALGSAIGVASGPWLQRSGR